MPATFLEALPFPNITEEHQEEIVRSIEAVRENARHLRAEAEAGWQVSKQWFEEQLLGAATPC